MIHNKHWRYPAISFIAAFLLWCALFFLLGLAPFGNNIIFFSDLGAQYLPFMTAIKEMDFFYSFNNGIGGNMIPLIAYYLTSPLNLLTLFFSNEAMPVGIHLLIMLKGSLAAAAMSVYLYRTHKKDSMMIYALAIAYAFCGFTAVYFYNIMWLDALIWLPLATLSLQHLLDKGKTLPYILCLFMVIWSNYYLGYMICLFLLSYSIYWLYKEHGRMMWRPFFLFAGSSIVAALLTGVLLVPTVFGMLGTGKGDFSLSIFAPQVMYGLDGLAGFGTGVSDFSTRLNHLPTFYSSFIALVLAASYFTNPKIERNKKTIRAIFLGWLLIGTWFRPLLLVFQAFQPAAGFPYRNSFLVSFFVILLAFEGWLQKNKWTKRQLTTLAVGLIAMFILVYYVDDFTDQRLRRGMLLLSVVFTGVAAWLLSRRKKVFYVLALLVFMAIDVSANFLASIPGAVFTNQTDYQQYVQLVESRLSQRTNSLARVDNTHLDARDWGVNSNGYNEGMLYAYPGVAGYTSTLSQESLDLYQTYGLYSSNERRISYAGSTPWTDYLLNVGYRFNGGEFQETGNTVGIGFVIPSDIANNEAENPFENQNASFQAVFQTEELLFMPVSLLETIGAVTTVQVASDGPLYLWLEEGSFSSVLVEGREVEPKFGLDEGMMLDVGDYQAGDNVSIRIEADEPLTLTNEHLQTFQMQVFAERKSLPTLQNAKWQGNVLTGEVEVVEEGVLLLSILHEAGWEVMVDGEEVESASVLGGFIGIPVQSGSHTVHLKFVPPGFTIGLVCTLLGAGLILAWIFIQQKNKKSSVL